MNQQDQGSGQATSDNPLQQAANQDYDFKGVGDSPDGTTQVPAQQAPFQEEEQSAKEQAAGHVQIAQEPQAQQQAQPSSEEKQSNEEAKQQRQAEDNAQKSQSEWQEMKEQVNESKADSELADALKKALGITDKEVKEAEDPQQLMLSRITKLERDSVRKDFEADNPVVRTEQYSDKWQEICKLHDDPNHKYHSLDYDDLLALIKKDNPELERAEAEYRQQEKQPLERNSVPVTGKRSAKSSNLSPIEARAAAAMGYTDEDFKQAGVSL